MPRHESFQRQTLEARDSRQQLLQIDLNTKTEHDIHVKARADLRTAIEKLLWPEGRDREDQNSGHQ